MALSDAQRDAIMAERRRSAQFAQSIINRAQQQNIVDSRTQRATDRLNENVYPGSAGLRGDVYTDNIAMAFGDVASIQDARERASYVLNLFGLGTELLPEVANFIRREYNPTNIADYIRSTDVYKQRFAGNTAREKAGLTRLTESEYISTENNYRAAMRNYLPEGFYDSPSDFVEFMRNDLSANEIGARAQTAYALGQQSNPETRQALQDFYGIGDKEIAAYFLDPKKAQPLLQKRAQAAVIGAEALRSDIDINRSFAETLADEGVDQGRARQAFQEASTQVSGLRSLADISGEELSTQDVVNAEFQRDVKAANKVKRLRSQQRARFGGASAGPGVLDTGLNVDRPGSF